MAVIRLEAQRVEDNLLPNHRLLLQGMTLLRRVLLAGVELGIVDDDEAAAGEDSCVHLPVAHLLGVARVEGKTTDGGRRGLVGRGSQLCESIYMDVRCILCWISGWPRNDTTRTFPSSLVAIDLNELGGALSGVTTRAVA